MFKRRFTAALALAGMTRKEWAKQQGICYHSLHLLIEEKLTSKRLTAEAERFINRVFKEHLTVSSSSDEDLIKYTIRVTIEVKNDE
jgi:hypothetical protein